jgi:hypothetical protein
MLLVAVVVVAGFCVHRLHGIVGSHNTSSATGGFSDETAPFSPKHVVLEFFGPPCTEALISYLDVNTQPQRVDDTGLPWSYDVTTTEPAALANIVAQGETRDR